VRVCLCACVCVCSAFCGSVFGRLLKKRCISEKGCKIRPETLFCASGLRVFDPGLLSLAREKKSNDDDDDDDDDDDWRVIYNLYFLH